MAGPGQPMKRPAVVTNLPAGANRPASRPPVYRQGSSDYFSRSNSPTSSAAASPIMFNSARSSLSTVSTLATQPPATRPLVLVRKASSSRVNLPPLSTAPPSTRLPPPPLSPLSASASELDESIDSLDFPDVPSSTSSGVSFATMKFEMHSGDEILQLMRNGFADAPEDVDEYSESIPTTPREGQSTSHVSPPSSYRPSPTGSASSQLAVPKPLKKALSHQNMGRRPSEASVASIASSSADDIAKGGSHPSPNGKVPRKQRSFHHPRLPLPSLTPLRHPSSPPGSSHSHMEQTAPKNPPQNPIVPQYTRRRLFSGSSGRSSAGKTSNSPPPTADDDIRSLLSLESKESSMTYPREHTPQKARCKATMVSFANMGNQLSLVTENACIAPAWDEIGSYHTPTANRGSTSDYVPQHIMSPADMLRLEEALANEDIQREEREAERDYKPRLELDPGEFGMSFVGNGRRSTRSRTNSTLSSQSSASAATLAFGDGERLVDDSSARGTYPRTAMTPSRRPATADMYAKPVETKSPDRIASTARVGKAPSLSTRPSTAQPTLRLSPPPSPTTYKSSPELLPTSLPPPPRPRPNRERDREQTSSPTEQDDTIFRRMSAAPFNPLSPPPRRRPAKPVTIHDDRDEDGFSMRSSRPPSAFNAQKLSNRRSVMKKPSFLDFEDEIDHDEDDLTDATMEMQSSPTEMESSFLDLDRGKDSFDTIRSSGDNAHAF